MGFASGFITGLAKTVDDQLKNDMLRTQKRMDGMEQYRVTRRRAEDDRVKKDTKEVFEAMKNLSTFVGGDMFKAKQLFATGGGTVTGATNFYNFLNKNRVALGEEFKIDTIVPGLNATRPEGISEADYVANFVEGAKVIKSQGKMEGSGLLKAFGGDFGPTVDRNVEEQSSLTESKFGTIPTKPLTVNYEALVDSQAYKKANQIAPKGTFMAEYLSLDKQYYNETDSTKQKAIGKRRDDMYAKYEKDKELSKSATGKSTTLFSKESVTSIIDKANVNSVKGAGYTSGVGETLKILLDGNEGQVFEAKDNALKSLYTRFKSTKKESEPILFNALEAEVELQKTQRQQYKSRQEDLYKDSIADDDSVGFDKYQDFNATQAVISSVTIPQAASAELVIALQTQAIAKEAKSQRYAAGKVIEYKTPTNKIVKLIWTGNRLIN